MKAILIFLSLIVFRVALADLDPASQEALKQTQQLLENTGDRQKMINQNPEFQKVDSKLDSFSGNEQNKQKLYELSSQVMKSVTEKNAGDPEAMNKILDEAQKNPEKFYKEYFNGEQQDAIRKLANEIQKAKPSN